MKPGIYHCKTKPSIVVELIGQAVFRLGETKQPCVVYSRNNVLHVRTRGEFEDKFYEEKPKKDKGSSV